MKPDDCPMDEVDRHLVLATQAGLPLVSRPYDWLAEQLGIETGEVLRRLSTLQARGAIRRIGAVPNHYAIGYVANGMSVWDIDDAWVDAVGTRLGRLEGVSHCYRRPRSLPDWPYNLFAMVHGHHREETDAQARAMAALIESEFPGALRSRDILYSTRILKKTGLRIAG